MTLNNNRENKKWVSVLEINNLKTKTSGRGRGSLTDSWEKRGKLWLQTSGLLSYKAWTFHIRLYRQICRNEWRTGTWEESRDNLCLFAAVFRAECLTYFAWLLRSVTFTLPRTKFRYSLKRQAQKHIKKKWEQNLPCNDGWMVQIRHGTDPFFFGKYASISKNTFSFSLICVLMSVISSSSFSSHVCVHLWTENKTLSYLYASKNKELNHEICLCHKSF